MQELQLRHSEPFLEEQNYHLPPNKGSSTEQIRARDCNEKFTRPAGWLPNPSQQQNSLKAAIFVYRT